MTLTKPSYSAAGLSIEPVRPDDVPDLLAMVGEIAEHLGASENFFNTADNLSQALFATPPLVEAVIARHEGRTAGFALWLEKYRVFSGRKMLWLDYLYVRPEYRRMPLGIGLLVYVLNLARARDYIAIQGTVLDANETARNLYAILKIEELNTRTFNLTLSKVNWSLLGRFHVPSGVEPVLG